MKVKDYEPRSRQRWCKYGQNQTHEQNRAFPQTHGRRQPWCSEDCVCQGAVLASSRTRAQVTVPSTPPFTDHPRGPQRGGARTRHRTKAWKTPRAGIIDDHGAHWPSVVYNSHTRKAAAPLGCNTSTFGPSNSGPSQESDATLRQLSGDPDPPCAVSPSSPRSACRSSEVVRQWWVSVAGGGLCRPFKQLLNTIWYSS